MIRTAIAGLGNCASSLVQGIAYCRAMGDDVIGLPLPVLGFYTPQDIEVVAAFDIDERKVGLDVAEAIFAQPNCTAIFHKNVPKHNVSVSRGPTLDGVTNFMTSR